jgi:hypothetical protein
MFVFKRIAGFAFFANGPQARPFLHFLLIVLSLIGMMSRALVTGHELDLDSVSELTKLGLFTLLSAYGSHWIYRVLYFIRDALTRWITTTRVSVPSVQHNKSMRRI